MFKGQGRQGGASLWSMLLGMALSLAVLLLWQRLLFHTHAAAKVRQVRAEAVAQAQWLQARLHQDVAATLSPACVLPPGHGIRLSHASSFTLTPRLWSQPLLASQGHGRSEQYILTHVVVAATPQLLAYLAAPDDYGWALSRCDQAWAFQPAGWTRLAGERLLIWLSAAWAIGAHAPSQPGLLSLQVTETVGYEVGEQGVARVSLSQPYLLAERAPRLTLLQLQPWWRVGCGDEVGFQTLPSPLASPAFYEALLGWREAGQDHVLASTMVALAALPASGC